MQGESAQHQQRELYNGFGDGLTRAAEFAITPTVFGAVGYVLDRIFGIVPVLTISFVLFAIVGLFVKLWYAYDAEMKAHEAAAPWGRKRGTAP